MSLKDINISIRTALEAIIVPIISYGVYLLNDMNQNIQKLNTQVAIILAERDVTKDILKDHESRLRFLEGRK